MIVFNIAFVVDFIDWFIPCRGPDTWSRTIIDTFAPAEAQTIIGPTFNVADVAISVGIGLIAVDALFLSRDTRAKVLAKLKDAPVCLSEQGGGKMIRVSRLIYLRAWHRIRVLNTLPLFGISGVSILHR